MDLHPHLNIDESAAMQPDDDHPFFPPQGYTGNDAEHSSFNPAFDYASQDQLNIAQTHHNASLTPTWGSSLLQHDPTSDLSTTSAQLDPTSRLHAPYYASSYANNPSALQIPHFAPHALNSQYSSPYDTNMANSAGMDSAIEQSPYTATISPHALQNNFSTSQVQVTQGRNPSYQNAAQQQNTGNLQNSIVFPTSQVHGQFLITDADALSSATGAQALHRFVHVGDVVQDIHITKSTIPTYFPRKSRTEIKKLLATDSTLAAKLSKTSTKKSSVASGKAPAAKPDRVAVRALAGTKRRAPSSSGDESSDNDSAANSSDEESEMPSPLPAVRPTVALEAVKYDTLKALWRPTNRAATADEIRTGLKAFWEVIQTIRDRWKADVAAVKQAEETKKLGELPLLKERVQTQRQMLEAALKAALESGHPDILEHMGENMPYIVCLAQFLADRSRDSDHDGSLSQAMLETLARCKTLTDGSLEKTNINKVLPRFQKRGNEKTQGLCRRIHENAVAALKKKREAAKASASSAPANKDAKQAAANAGKTSAPETGMKRQRSGDNGDDQPQKKGITEQARGFPISSTGTNGQPKGSPVAPKKQAAAASDAKSTTTAAATKSKILVPVSKASGLLSSLQSAAKKPGTSNAAVAAAAAQAKTNSAPATALEKKSTPEKKAIPARATVTQPPKASFSWSETMASLNQPQKAEPSAKPSDKAQANETEEQRTKRLRKEKRRSLRVKFKPDNSLVDIRYFTHDPEEELGHDPSMVRDVGDTRSEGRMLKLHKDQMDLDEDDDDSGDAYEMASKEWRLPSLIDFSTIDKQQRSVNYEAVGGGFRQPISAERIIQEQREAITLMEFYANSADIPPSPREPADPYSGEIKEFVEFGPPPDAVLQRVMPLQASNTVQPQMSTAEIAAILSRINARSTEPAPPQPPPQYTPLTELERVFAQFATQPPQSVSAPPMMAQPAAPALSQPPDMQAILASLTTPAAPAISAAPNMQALLASLTSFAPTPAVTAYAPPPPATTPPNLQAILAQLNHSTQPSQPSQPSQPIQPIQPASNASMMMPNFGMPNFGVPPPQPHPNQGSMQGQPYTYENEERKRWRETSGDNHNSNNNNYNEHSEGGNDWNGQSGSRKISRKDWSKDKKGSRNPPMFVVQCKYWKEGKCRKGADCTFLHE